MTNPYARSTRLVSGRPNARPGVAGRKPPPLPLAWRVGGLALTLLLIAGLAVPVLRFVGGRVIAAFDQQAEWRGGYTGQFLVVNDTKNALHDWSMEFDLPAGSKILRHWGATMTTKGDHYVFQRDGAKLEEGKATRVQFIVQGTGKPTNCKMNETPCDQGKDTVAPTAPSGLQVAGVSVSAVRLAWQPSTDNVAVNTYRVYMDGKVAASTSATSTTISRLRRGTRHRFVVTAIDMKGNESARNAAVSATTTTSTDRKKPTAPTRLAVGKVTTLSAAISWKAAKDNVGVAGYNVYEGGDVVATSAKPRVTITALSAGTKHTYTVTAVDAAENESSKSAPIRIKTADFTTPTAGGPVQATTAALTGQAGQAGQAGQLQPVRLVAAQTDIDQLPFLADQVSQQAQVTAQLQQQAQQAKLLVQQAEQQAAQINQQVEQAAQLAKFQIQQAEQQADQIKQQVGAARQQAGQIIDQARQAQKEAQKLTDKARQASADAGQDINAQQEAQQLIQQAVQAQQFAQQLSQQAQQAGANVQQAQQQAQQARFQVEQARQQADQADQQGAQARQQGRQQIKLAEQQADQVQKQADQAQRALDKALKALSDAQGGKTVDDPPSRSNSDADGHENEALGSPRLKVVRVTDSSVTLSWTAPRGGAGIAAYDILRAGNVVQRVGGDSTTTVVTGLDAESRFTFSVVARAEDGSSSKPSNTAETVTVASGLDDTATPANLHATCVTDHSVSLDWDAPAGAGDGFRYDVYAQGRKVASVLGTSTTIDGLGAGENVQFVVKSRDSAGRNSPPSRVVSVTTLQAGEKPQKPGDYAVQTAKAQELTTGQVPGFTPVHATGTGRKTYRFGENAPRRRPADGSDLQAGGLVV
jgi:chitodextrinase